jgi:hypothetical protein
MKKIAIFLIIAILLSSAALAICPDPKITDDKNNPDCTTFELTADNVKDLKPEQISTLKPEQLTADVLGHMNSQQVAQLTQQQLTASVIIAMPDETMRSLTTSQLSNTYILGSIPSDKLKILRSNQLADERVLLALGKASILENADPKEFKDAFNSVYPSTKGKVYLENAESLSGVTLKKVGESTFIQDSSGNSFDLGGEATISIDLVGLVHIKKGNSLPVWREDKQIGSFTGDGSVDKSGIFTCADGKGCSATAFGENAISLKSSSNNQIIKVSGKDAFVELNEQGRISGMKGIMENDDSFIFNGKSASDHYEVSWKRGTSISFSDGGFSEVNAKGDFKSYYFDETSGNAVSTVELKDGGEFSMSGSDSAEIKSCIGTCSYRNRDESKMKGFNLPENGAIEMNIAKGGSMTFGEGAAGLKGKETNMRVLDGNNGVVMSTTNVESGSTRVMLGDTKIANEKDINSNSCDGKCNLVLFKSEEKEKTASYSAEVYTQNDNKVDIFMPSADPLNNAHIVTQAGGVHGTLAINSKNPTYVFPELSVVQWKEQTSEATSEANTLQPSGKLAQMIIGDGETKTTISAASTNGQISLLADRLNKNGNMYKISTSDEYLYSDGVNSALLGYEDGKYVLKSVRSGLGVSINDNEKMLVRSTLSLMGMPEEDIRNVQRFGQNLFTDVEQNDISAEARAAAGVKALEEITKQVEGTTTLPGTDIVTEGTATTAPATPGQLLTDEDRKVIQGIRPGSVEGNYYQSDADVQAMVKALGFNDVKGFQAAAGIQVDGYAGVQTSAALLLACQNTGRCNDANLDPFTVKVINPVVRATATALDPAHAATAQAQPGSLRAEGRNAGTQGTSGTPTTGFGRSGIDCLPEQCLHQQLQQPLGQQQALQQQLYLRKTLQLVLLKTRTAHQAYMTLMLEHALQSQLLHLQHHLN